MSRRSYYLEFHDNAKNKHRFYRVTFDGNGSATLQWGRVGTAGQSQTKPADEAEMVLEEKRRKGYAEPRDGAQKSRETTRPDRDSGRQDREAAASPSVRKASPPPAAVDKNEAGSVTAVGVRRFIKAPAEGGQDPLVRRKDRSEKLPVLSRWSRAPSEGRQLPDFVVLNVS